MTSRARVIGLCLGVIACGSGSGANSASPVARYAMPDPKLARAAPATNAGGEVVCAGGMPYDARRGCWFRRAEGVPIAVELRFDMEGFTLIGAALAVDGELAFDANDPELFGRARWPLLETELGPGTHELGVLLVLAGNGHGVFAYLREYRFEVRAQHELTIDRDSRPGVVVIEAYEKDGLATPLEQRPAVRFVTR